MVADDASGFDEAADDARRRESAGIPTPVQQTPQVMAGEDDVPRQPTSQRDPFVPEPGPRPGEQRAFRALRLALIPLAIAIAIVLYAAFR